MAIILLALPVSFSCVKDSCKQLHTYSYYVPVYKTKQEVRDNIKSHGPKPVENPGKLNILGNYIFLNEVDKGIHVIDNANPSDPCNVAFIEIPGNLDIAIKGNTLYADLYTDLVALDISNPLNVKTKKIIDNLFPLRYYGNGFVGSGSNNTIIAEWVKKDTTVEMRCDNNFGPIGIWFDTRNVFFSTASVGSQAGGSSSPIGVGGSMARFTIINNRLYTVNESALDVFNITNPADPGHSNHINIGWGIETIYPFKNKLFIGSQSGMFIYSVNNADAPSQEGTFSHVQSCDPVIADDNYAYVTLRSGSVCQGFTNQLDVIKLNNITNPALYKTYEMTNPHGLSKDGNTLFICDGAAGLKVYNAANVSNLQLIKTVPGIETYDVIAYNSVALVVAKDGLYQYDYSNLSNIRLLSKINVNKE